ncbi:MAG: TIGR02147 family protein [Fibrobacteria bacterium]|nr:TIGR02147 family protein [Fibrobacteria bacterium]
MAVSVYTFTDYRKYLADYFDYRRQKEKGLTLQIISQKLGMKSSGNLSAMLLGKYNISPSLASAIAKYCRLKKKESEYFKAMVFFNQAKGHTQKRAYFEKLISFHMSCVYKVNPHAYKFYDRWYHAVIRALTEFMDVKSNYAQVATMLTPYIRAAEAKSSLKLLEELELIAPDVNGYLRPTSKCIDTGIPTTSVTIDSFGVSMLDKAKEALDRFSVEDMILSWNTLGLDKERFGEVMEAVREFRYKVADIIKDHKSNCVYQLNVQAFPVSKTYKKQKEE